MIKKKTYKVALSMFAGFLTIFLLNTFFRLLIYREVRGMVQTSSTIDTMLYSPLLHTVITLLIPIIGGVVVGYLIKERGWFYAGILAVILKIISIAIIATLFFSPAGSPDHMLARQNIVRQLISSPFSVFFVAWGGWVGERVAHFSQKHSDIAVRV